MLRTQDHHQADARRAAQQVDIAPPQALHAGLVREQRDALAGDDADRVRQQDLDPRSYLRRRPRRQGEGAGNHHQQRDTMRAHRLLVVAAVLGCSGGQTVRRTATPVPRPSSSVPVVSVDSLLAGLTVHQQVGQLVIPWLSGSYTALDDSLYQVAARWVDSLEIGGLIISVGSPLDIATKLNALQLRSRLPLLISADLEWGAGMRVVGATAFPQIMAVGGPRGPHDPLSIGAAAAGGGPALGNPHQF